MARGTTAAATGTAAATALTSPAWPVWGMAEVTALKAKVVKMARVLKENMLGVRGGVGSV